MDGWMDGWTDGRVDGWMDGLDLGVSFLREPFLGNRTPTFWGALKTETLKYSSTVATKMHPTNIISCVELFPGTPGIPHQQQAYPTMFSVHKKSAPMDICTYWCVCVFGPAKGWCYCWFTLSQAQSCTLNQAHTYPTFTFLVPHITHTLHTYTVFTHIEHVLHPIVVSEHWHTLS